MPISPPDDARVALVMRVEHMHGDPLSDVVITACDYCDEPVYADPHTIELRNAGEMIGKLECCCCADTHDPFQMLRKMLENPEGAHFHDFSEGDCSCGETAERWASLPEDARKIHDVMQRVYEKLKTEQEEYR